MMVRVGGRINCSVEQPMPEPVRQSNRAGQTKKSLYARESSRLFVGSSSNTYSPKIEMRHRVLPGLVLP